MTIRSLPAVNAPAYRSGALALLLSTAIILAALAFEHLGGYPPCPLCLMQRYAYYAAIPLLFAALVLDTAEFHEAARLIFFVVVIRCDEAPWQFLGLSFAGWNAVLSLLLCAVSMRAGISARRRS